MKNNTIFRLFAFSSLFAAVCLIAACGKAGMPVPKKTQETFTITESNLSPIGACVVAQGTISGAIRNVDGMSIEVASVQSADDCPGCPFVPREFGDFTLSEIQLNNDTGFFSFSFCPAETAPMYRWRLVGKNVYRGLPHATTTPKVTVMP